MAAYKPFASLKFIPALAVLLVCILPIFQMLMFFWPLILSTALGVLAVVSFYRQSEKQDIPEIAESGIAVSGRQRDLTARPPIEQKIGNVLMVGNQEVTWLEWLHYEDTQELCVHELHEPAAWDTYGYDISSMTSKACVAASVSTRTEDVQPSTVSSDGSLTCKDEASNNGTSWAEDKNRPDGPSGLDAAAPSALVLTEEDVLRMGVTASTTSNGCSGTRILEEDVNRDGPRLTFEDDTMLDLTEEDNGTCGVGSKKEDHTPRNTVEHGAIVLPVNDECGAGAPAFPKTDEGIEVLCLRGAGGNECKPVKVPEDNGQEAEGRDLKQSITQGPRWDVSDGEEDQSGLRFSFFHNNSSLNCSKV